MAICADCNREMTLAASCVVRFLRLGGVVYQLETHRSGRSPADPRSRCGDCGVRPGGYHHLGCDVVRCPRCGGQLIACGCWDDEDEDAGEVEPVV
jgi:hypothetical protein